MAGQEAIAATETRFVVLMATLNGAAHLGEQIASLDSQSVARIDILASDDGSSDATPEILGRAESNWRRGSFEIVPGPCRGFSENFRSLILRACRDADFYALCDQDDIWDSAKLSVARESLERLPVGVSGLYCGRTRLVTEDGEPAGCSPVMARQPSFRNALVQSIAGGNTMVMNTAAFEVLRASCEDTVFVSHDWWAYIVVSGAGGHVIYDPVPHLSYRQHGNNLIGANIGVAARFQRSRALLQGVWRNWMDINCAALAKTGHLLTDENQAVLAEFTAMRREPNPFRRLRMLKRAGIYRQSLIGETSMRLAVLIGKL